MAKCIFVAIVLLNLLNYSFAGPIPEEFKEIQPEIRKTCLTESGADVDLIERFGKGDFVEDPKLKCYHKCVFDQFRLVSSKGFNFEIMIKVAPPSYKPIARQLGDLCKDIKGKDGDVCDFAYNISKCFYTNFPEQFFVM